MLAGGKRWLAAVLGVAFFIVLSLTHPGRGGSGSLGGPRHMTGDEAGGEAALQNGARISLRRPPHARYTVLTLCGRVRPAGRSQKSALCGTSCTGSLRCWRLRVSSQTLPTLHCTRASAPQN